MALVITIKVVPHAGKQGWALDKSGTLKCYLKSPAERGLANQELVKLLAKALGVTQAHVTILTGTTSRTKLIKIERVITLAAVMSLLGIEKQLSIG